MSSALFVSTQLKRKLRAPLISITPPLSSGGQHDRLGQNENYLIRPIVKLRF